MKMQGIQVKKEGVGFRLVLDRKGLRTPARRPLILPTASSARLAAAEESVRRLANAAIDGVALRRKAVFDSVLKFAESDLLCYRASHPRELVAAQAEAWNPILDWLRDEWSVDLVTAQGIAPVTQKPEAMKAFSVLLRRHDEAFRLTCIHSIAALTGSAALAVALACGRLDSEAAWKAAHVDEDWNRAQWGEDEEAANRREAMRCEMLAAADLLAALG